MKKSVKILGIGRSVSGTSKAGKEYNFTPVSFAYTEDHFAGYKAETVNIDSSMIREFGSINVNDQLEFVFHYQNFRPVVDAIL